jgi:hypothetical protein
MDDDRQQLEVFTTDLQKINRYFRCKTFNNVERTITRVQWLLLRYLYRKPNRIMLVSKFRQLKPSMLSLTVCPVVRPAWALSLGLKSRMVKAVVTIA